MASMNFTSFSISKANIFPQPSLSFPQKASRVCFTSASKHSQRIYASDGTNYATGKPLSDMGADATDKLKEGQKAAGEIKDKSIDDLKEATEKMKGNVAEITEKVSNSAGKSSDQAGDFAKQRSQEVQEIAKEAADKIGEDANKVAEMATAAKDQAIDAAGAAAEKTKKAAEGAWDAAKGAFAKED